MYTSFYNAGLDSAELVSQLRAAHAEEDTKMGVDVVLGQAGDMSKLGIYESFRVGSIFRFGCIPASNVLRLSQITGAQQPQTSRLRGINLL